MNILLLAVLSIFKKCYLTTLKKPTTHISSPKNKIWLLQAHVPLACILQFAVVPTQSPSLIQVMTILFDGLAFIHRPTGNHAPVFLWRTTPFSLFVQLLWIGLNATPSLVVIMWFSSDQSRHRLHNDWHLLRMGQLTHSQPMGAMKLWLWFSVKTVC